MSLLRARDLAAAPPADGDRASDFVEYFMPVPKEDAAAA